MTGWRLGAEYVYHCSHQLRGAGSEWLGLLKLKMGISKITGRPCHYINGASKVTFNRNVKVNNSGRYLQTRREWRSHGGCVHYVLSLLWQIPFFCTIGLWWKMPQTTFSNVLFYFLFDMLMLSLLGVRTMPHNSISGLTCFVYFRIIVSPQMKVVFVFEVILIFKVIFIF